MSDPCKDSKPSEEAWNDVARNNLQPVTEIAWAKDYLGANHQKLSMELLMKYRDCFERTLQPKQILDLTEGIKKLRENGQKGPHYVKTIEPRTIFICEGKEYMTNDNGEAWVE